MEAMLGRIFNIQKFCIDDGPGIRTTVFLKGCPLRCAWCHNPEGLDIKKSIEIDNSRCILCGKCQSICENGCHTIETEHRCNIQCCSRCGKCIEICPTKAINWCGYYSSVEDVMKIILSDKIFYEKSGGLTVSGGEPMLQHEYLLSLLELAKNNGIHTCLETSGYCDSEIIKKVAPVVDIFLYDIKETDDENHKKYTGVSNKQILNNLRILNEMNCCISLRCPIIPGVNDRKSHFENLAKMYKKLKNPYEIQLMPYHTLRLGKLSRYGFSDDELVFKQSTAEQISGWKECLDSFISSI